MLFDSGCEATNLTGGARAKELPRRGARGRGRDDDFRKRVLYYPMAFLSSLRDGKTPHQFSYVLI